MKQLLLTLLLHAVTALPFLPHQNVYSNSNESTRFVSDRLGSIFRLNEHHEHHEQERNLPTTRHDERRLGGADSQNTADTNNVISSHVLIDGFFDTYFNYDLVVQEAFVTTLSQLLEEVDKASVQNVRACATDVTAAECPSIQIRRARRLSSNSCAIFYDLDLISGTKAKEVETFIEKDAFSAAQFTDKLRNNFKKSSIEGIDVDAVTATPSKVTVRSEQPMKKETEKNDGKDEGADKIARCIHFHGQIKNKKPCMCSNILCDYQTFTSQGYCDINRPIEPCFINLAHQYEVRLKISTNLTCRQAGAMSLDVIKDKPLLCTKIHICEPSQHECKFTGDPCQPSSSNRAQNKSCICSRHNGVAKGVCTPKIGMVCAADVDASTPLTTTTSTTTTTTQQSNTCTFADACADQNAGSPNEASCSCGSTHCSKSSWTYVFMFNIESYVS